MTWSRRSGANTFLDRGPEVIDFLLEKTPVRFAWVPEYSDYLPEQPGGRPRGRTMEPVPMDGRIIGAELERLHPAYTKAPANLIVTQADFRKISLGPLRTLRGARTMFRVLFNRMVSHVPRPADVRDGQRPDDQPAQGPDGCRTSRSTTRPR